MPGRKGRLDPQHHRIEQQADHQHGQDVGKHGRAFEEALRIHQRRAHPQCRISERNPGIEQFQSGVDDFRRVEVSGSVQDQFVTTQMGEFRNTHHRHWRSGHHLRHQRRPIIIATVLPAGRLSLSTPDLPD